MFCFSRCFFNYSHEGLDFYRQQTPTKNNQPKRKGEEGRDKEGVRREGRREGRGEGRGEGRESKRNEGEGKVEEKERRGREEKRDKGGRERMKEVKEGRERKEKKNVTYSFSTKLYMVHFRDMVHNLCSYLLSLLSNFSTNLYFLQTDSRIKIFKSFVYNRRYRKK